MVGQHDSVGILEIIVEGGPVSVSGTDERREERTRATHFRPRIAMDSLRSILALKPPLAHCSAAPLLVTLLRMRRLPTSAAVTAPTMTGLAV